MDRPQTTRIDKYIALWGIVFICSSLIFDQFSIFLGVGLGVLLAIANWFALKHLGLKVMASGTKLKARFGIFLALKSTLLFGAVVAVLLFAPVHPVALVVGISSLLMGVLTHTIQQIFTQDQDKVSVGRES
jgi:hypothetical protein